MRAVLYNAFMLKPSRRRRAPGVSLSVVLVACMACAGRLPAEGLAPLQKIVDDACACAGQYATGMDAAIRCTQGPLRFGRFKVAQRDGWNDAQRAAAADLEAIIETCIANAEDAISARDRLGVVPVNDDGSPVAAYWKRVAPSELVRHPSKLVRISRGGSDSVKGLVLSGDGDGMVLSRARVDGGGRERIAYDVIQEAWVMEIPGR